MAAHDDKISTNRRRLFKALSAAPVVMTLRPGSAAATSAYQCLAKIRLDDVQPTLAPTDLGPVSAPVAPFKYAGPLPYWVIDPSEAPEGCLLPDTTFIVLRDSTYYDDSGEEIVPLPFSLDGTSLVFPAVGERCYTAIRQEGYFVIVGLANADDTYFEERGSYPVYTGGDPGITGTCRASLDAAGLYKSLI